MDKISEILNNNSALLSDINDHPVLIENIIGILRNIENIELPEILQEYPNEEILDSIKHLDKSYQPRYLIDIFN